MAFGIYVHIPFCLQRCTYCDFATVSWDQSLPPREYFQLLLHELKLRRAWVAEDSIDSIYFGGGTPSLVGPQFIVSMIHEIENHGFRLKPETEVTIEINPATLDRRQLTSYLRGGVNRFSVGAQTFSEKLLRPTARQHSVQDTRDTLDLLSQQKVNYTLDVLFALPGQTLADLHQDLDQVLEYAPNHVSAYCLTVPEQHPMAKGRAPEDEQVAMFEALERRLGEAGIQHYEISNYARPGFESQHNLIYWTDQPYWGLGMSAHSYLKNSKWGTRFWNPSQIPEYQRQLSHCQFPENQKEILKLHQATTDYCHTSLRLLRGMDLDALRNKFSPQVVEIVLHRMEKLLSQKLLEKTSRRWHLSRSGRVLPNLVFQELTFLEGEVSDIDNP